MKSAPGANPTEVNDAVRAALLTWGSGRQLGHRLPVGGVGNAVQDDRMRREIAIVCALLCAACEASIEGGTRITNTPDATTSGDSGMTSSTVDAPKACFNGRVVYLNFDGVTLTDGATSDATQNRASWMQIPTGTVPPFLQGQANRATIIQAITNGVVAQLSQFPITVVTTRPATGPYVMIVYGGNAQNVGSNYGFAVNELDCDDSEKSDVAWISGDGYTTNQRHINTTIGAIGFGLGLTATTNVNDCMCGWANGCQKDHSVACTLSTNITRDVNATQRCAGAPATQNEVATFSSAFCE